MSMAKLQVTEKSRKAWKCGRCGDEVPVGSRVIRFTVGFRGRPQERCSKTECFPKPSERESSAVASAYAAQEEFTLNGCTSIDEIVTNVEMVAEAFREVASDYEESAMFDRNEDLHSRAQVLNDAAEEVENWMDSLGEEPNSEDEEWFGSKSDFGPAWDKWFEEAKDAALTTVTEVEIP